MGNEKQQRRLKRKQREEAQKKAYKHKLQRTLPGLVFETAEGDASFCEEIEGILEEYWHHDKLPSTLARQLLAFKNDVRETNLVACDQCILELGRFIFAQLKQSFQTRFRLAHDLRITPILNREKNSIKLTLHSLQQLERGEFISPRKQLVQIDGGHFRLAYHIHALERIGERTVLDPDWYECRGQAFAIPYWGRYFELVDLPTGDHAVKIWNWCDPSTPLGKVHLEMLGEAAVPQLINGTPFILQNQQICCYLVGYCPIKLRNETMLASLTSCWLPGMDKTPEFHLWSKEKRPSTVERSDFSRRAKESTYKGMLERNDYSFVALLNHYVPQVKPIKERLFSYPEIPF